ncbi:hypothetical protein SCHPADRAFT_940949 [Schizopora paradoxa]|uniref:Protein kinase domain-containing protein n=1 Tax=Schizopora paradoxa TaxID=27342 RepID=A0A0H2S7D6_9AGAM|nr:hypothetical protein SCHPADRAFT_940949 [Schizopora paradoxa]
MTSGTSEAIKVLQPRDLEGKSVEDSRRFWNEVIIWSRLRHENILPLLGLAELYINGTREIGLVSPWARNGNINDYFQVVPNIDRLPMVRGVAEGLSYLHKSSVIRGDLRGAYVLVSDLVQPMLCDSGFANVVGVMVKMSVSRFWEPPLDGSRTDHRGQTSEEKVRFLGLCYSNPRDTCTYIGPFSDKSNDGQVVIAL